MNLVRIDFTASDEMTFEMLTEGRMPAYAISSLSLIEFLHLTQMSLRQKAQYDCHVIETLNSMTLSVVNDWNDSSL